MELSVDRIPSHWWVFVLKGIFFILVGVYMIASPVTSFAALGFFFGLIIFLAGVAELLRVTRERTQTGRSWHLALGIIDIILGLVLMGHVATSMFILRLILGLWFLFRGISLFSFARLGHKSWVLIVGAILIFVFGLLILFNPTFGDMTIILWAAIAFIITGIFNTWLGFSLKSVSN
jgi:uncharacterized membrane protein HdeD (DUF308 family)